MWNSEISLGSFFASVDIFPSSSNWCDFMVGQRARLYLIVLIFCLFKHSSRSQKFHVKTVQSVHSLTTKKGSLSIFYDLSGTLWQDEERTKLDGWGSLIFSIVFGFCYSFTVTILLLSTYSESRRKVTKNIAGIRKILWINSGSWQMTASNVFIGHEKSRSSHWEKEKICVPFSYPFLSLHCVSMILTPTRAHVNRSPVNLNRKLRNELNLPDSLSHRALCYSYTLREALCVCHPQSSR